MQDTKLIKLSWISAILGILLLLLVKDHLELEYSQIKNLDSSLLDQKVRTTGIVKSIYENPDSYFVIIKSGNQSIGVSIFSKDLEIKNDSILEVEGTLNEFNNKLSINADKVWI
tara:strand:+ start:1085 stop:1426 length:342 start_codon:yes stop_codon:yes gene_type:complete